MKTLFIVLGSVALGLGVLGIFLPLLPTTPFLLLTVFCYARGSEKFHNWFLSTKLYKNYVENYARDKTMTIKQKLTILGSVSVLMGISFYFMENIYARIIMVMVVIGHIIYFGFIVETKGE